MIDEPPGDLPLLFARLNFDLEHIHLDLEVVVLPTIPDRPVDPSLSTPP